MPSYTCSSLDDNVRKDLLVWWKFLEETRDGLPIHTKLEAPPLHHKVITTDAAGWKMDNTDTFKVGMGCIGLDEEGEIFMAGQEFWETESSHLFLDSKGKSLGAKTTTLEFAGILIPFLCYPEKLSGCHVIVQVDNISCHYGWKMDTLRMTCWLQSLSGHSHWFQGKYLVMCK